MGRCKKIFVWVPFLKASFLEEKVFKRLKMTLLYKKTHFVLVFVEKNHLKASGLDISVLKNWLNFEKLFMKSFFESQ